MAVAEILRRLAASGVHLTREGDKLIASPRERLNDDLRALIRCHKADLLQAEELKRLVRTVGTRYNFTEAEHVEALEVALSDLPVALRLFRDLTGRRPS